MAPSRKDRIIELAAAIAEMRQEIATLTAELDRLLAAGEPEGEPDKAGESLKHRILTLLRSERGAEMTAQHIASRLDWNRSVAVVRAMLKKLVDEGEVRVRHGYFRASGRAARELSGADLSAHRAGDTRAAADSFITPS